MGGKWGVQGGGNVWKFGIKKSQHISIYFKKNCFFLDFHFFNFNEKPRGILTKTDYVGNLAFGENGYFQKKLKLFGFSLFQF